MAKASAPGKLILFGEHFVVYGLPAIATAVEGRTSADVVRAERYSLIDDRPETPGYKVEKFDQQTESIKLMFKAMDIDVSKASIRLGGDLVAASGVGASGASCAAIAAAADAEFKLGMDRDRINEIAFEGEKGYHGTPSGIDNSCSTYGGFIWFKKSGPDGKSLIEPMKSSVKLTIVVGNTGITSNTTKVVGDVKAQRDKDRAKFDRIFEDYSKLVEKAKAAIGKNYLMRIGELMSQNNALLREMGVSCKELDSMVEASMKAGALGAKLTGTGRGGLMIALVTDETKAKVASAIRNLGFKAEITGMGAEGVKVFR